MAMLISSSICMTSVEVRGVQVGVGVVLRGLLGISLFCSLASKAYRLVADTS
jgi:hypothetical protein